MPRISKDPDIRKAELTEIAAQLFHKQGFAKTSVDDIVAAAKVAKGTFYYYFKSKADALEAVVEHLSAKSLDVVAPIAGDESLGAVEKMGKVLYALRAHYATNSAIIDEMHDLGDDAFHVKSIIGSTTLMSPVFAAIMEQGIREGVFHGSHPDCVAEIILLASNFLLDDELFPAEERRMRERAEVIQDMTEKALGTAPGSLYFISQWEESK